MPGDSPLWPARAAAIPQMLVTPREAARALSICEKTLWSLTRRGDLPAVRIGRAVRYDVADLSKWIEQQKAK